MAKISGLEPFATELLDGSETVPLVKNGVTGRASLSAFVDGVTAQAADYANNAAVGAATAMVFVGGVLFATSAAGLLGTANGDYFAVQEADLATVYVNDAGAANQQAQYYTKAGIDSLFQISGVGGARVAAMGFDSWVSGAGELSVYHGFETGKTVTNVGVALKNATGIVAIGAQALANGNFVSDFGVFIGHLSGYDASEAYCATAIGLRTLYNVAGALYATVIGCDAGLGLTTGGSNVFVGSKSGYNCVEGDPTNLVNGGITGGANTGCGSATLRHISSGSYNSAFGNQALYELTTSSYNSAFGMFAGRDITTSGANALFGANSGYRLTTGLAGLGENAAFGFNALSAIDAGGIFQNAVFGSYAGQSFTGNRLTAFGQEAAKAATTATLLTAGGYRAGYQITTAPNCSLYGFMAGGALTTQNSVSAFGAESMSASTAAFSCAFGRQSLQNNTGSLNSAFGYQAHNGVNAFFNCATFGYNAQPTASNQVTLGDANIATLRCQQTTITALSDGRFKTDIEAVNDTLGLALVRRLPVRTFYWDRNRDTVPDDDRLQIGMIAQEWDKVLTKAGAGFMGVVDKSDPARWEAAPHKLFFPIMLSVQQLDRFVVNHEHRIATLEAQVANLDSELAALRAA